MGPIFTKSNLWGFDFLFPQDGRRLTSVPMGCVAKAIAIPIYLARR